MPKKMFSVRIEEDILNALQKVSKNHPRVEQSLLVNMALHRITTMSEDDLNRAIGEYFITKIAK